MPETAPTAPSEGPSTATPSAGTAGLRTDLGTHSLTLADLLPAAAEKYGSAPAVKYKDESGAWREASFEEVLTVVSELSRGLIDLGLKKGEKVSILANTRPEWTYFDFAALTAGAIVVPIYQTNSAEECQYVLENSDARFLVVEDEDQMEKVRAVRDRLPALEQVIRMTGSSEDAISMEDLLERGRGGDLEAWQAGYAAVTRDDVCTIIYTSGTTGPPKGCVLSHGNYRSMLDMALSKSVLESGETTYLFLPLAHVFALLIQFGSIDIGGCLAYWERDPLRIVPNLAEVKPSYFPSVPRIFEKVHTTATAGAASEGGIKKAIFDRAVATGMKYREVVRSGRKPGWLLTKRFELADKLVLSKIRAVFGGRIKQAVTGAAPIDPEILRFFDAAGVPVLEAWGMTETSTGGTVSTPDEFKFGSVGRAFPGVELKIAEDGELLIKGANIFQGYYKNPEATAEALVDGWLHTGDIAEIDSEGYVSITGRKKDIIITAGGKNITPANLEAQIKRHPLISQCVVIGDRRPYLIALITLDPEESTRFAAENGLLDDSADLASNAVVRETIEKHIDEVNSRFARVEQIKRFTILPKDLSQEGGELTPTLKIKRAVVAQKYEKEIDALYES